MPIMETTGWVVITGSQNNVSAASLFGSPTLRGTFGVVVSSGVAIGSSSAGAAFTSGTLPAGSSLYLVNRGRIQGRGGAGGAGATSALATGGGGGGGAGNLAGAGGTPGGSAGTDTTGGSGVTGSGIGVLDATGSAGGAGSLALSSTVNLLLDNKYGQIWGGGGGGGGGGVALTFPGSGGRGGDPGQAGSPGTNNGGAGGAAGGAIDVSTNHLIYLDVGDVRGGITQGLPTFSIQTKSADLDGTSENFTRLAQGTYGFASTFTLALWIKPNSTTFAQDNSFLSFLNTDALNNENRVLVHFFGTQVNDPLFLTLTNNVGGAAVFKQYRWDNALTQDAWNHLVFTYDGTTIQFYKNAVLTTESARLSDLPTTLDNAMRAFSVGSQADSTQFTPGRFHSFAVWNKVLSQASLTEIYQQGNAMDYRVLREVYSESDKNALLHWYRFCHLLGSPSLRGQDYGYSATRNLNGGTADDADAVADAPMQQ